MEIKPFVGLFFIFRAAKKKGARQNEQQKTEYWKGKGRHFQEKERPPDKAGDSGTQKLL